MWRDCRQQGRTPGDLWAGSRDQGRDTAGPLAQAQFLPGTISKIPEPQMFQASGLERANPHPPPPPAVLESLSVTSYRKPSLSQNQGFFQCLWPASIPACIWRFLMNYIYLRVPHSLLPEFKLGYSQAHSSTQHLDCSQGICV